MPQTSRRESVQTIRAGSDSPIVLTCEHASSRLPLRGRRSAAEREALASHWGWDIGAWPLTRRIGQRLDATVVGGVWSRLLIDLNRRVDDRTLIRPRAGGTEISWNRDLSPIDVERRIARYHTPYHAEIDRLLVRRLVRGVRPLLLTIHSFTPVYNGRFRPFEVGVLYERHADLAHRLGRDLRQTGLRVRFNQPYSGMKGMMYAADRHGAHFGLPCLELELNQKLFASRRAVPALGRVIADATGRLLEKW